MKNVTMLHFSHLLDCSLHLSTPSWAFMNFFRFLATELGKADLIRFFYIIKLLKAITYITTKSHACPLT